MSDLFSPGSRVSTNAEYAKRFPREPAKTGEVYAISKHPNRRRVVWDGRQSPETIRISFLEEGTDAQADH